MKFKNNLVFFTIFVFLIVISSGIVFAEDSNPAIPQIETGEVSGDVDIASAHPFASKVTSDELVYTIPENVSEIKSAYAVVNTYSGSGNYSYGLTTNIALKTDNTIEVLEYANLTFVNNTANDPVVYPITNHTSKQYSDYQTLVNITDKVKSLSSGDTITISVNNTKLTGYNFDGRIKLIALIFAYDDGDDDKISYWLNIGQAWTKQTLTTMFNTKDFDNKYAKATLESIALSSKDAIYTLNGESLSNPTQTKESMYIYDVWDITDNFKLSSDTNFTYDANGSSYKGSIQLLKVYAPEYFVSASIKSEYPYAKEIYAGVENTLTVTVNNGNKTISNGKVTLLIGDEEIDSCALNVGANSTATLTFTDDTIRPIDETTVSGANNTIVDYTLVISDATGKILNSTTDSFKVLYNGYLGKDYEYTKDEPTLRELSTTGDVIVLKTNDYSASGDTNRTDVFNVDLANGTVNTALLYVSYNWDKLESGDFNTWNTTFNGKTIAPIASYRDQSNLGTSGKYGYGLVVYDVTDFTINGVNTFEFSKTKGNAAVYPSNLIVLTNNDKSTFKKVYLLEEADLLSKSYNKNLLTGFNTSFDVIDGNATLWVFAASAQSGDGNLIINGVNNTNVWSGSDKSLDMYNTTVNGTDIDVYFEAIGSTILGLHQMVIVESDAISLNNKLKSEYTSADDIYAGVENKLTLTVTNEASNIENITVAVLLDGKELDSYTIASLNTGESNVAALIDPTIRPVTENTVNGNNNEKVNYTVIIKDAKGNIISENNFTFVVLYNGYLGKDYEYPKANQTLREFTISGDVIVLSTKDYSAGGDTNRTDVFNVDLANGTVNTALLYVSYNWDKVESGDFNTWNTTFNGKTITPIASYRDQANLGTTYAKYGYGLVVYNVTGLVVNGANTFEFSKTKGNVAVYPSNLIILTDNNKNTFKTVYLLEEADLLSTDYNKNLSAGFNTTFEIADGSASLYVFAASAQKGEGNLIINGEKYSDVWNGTTKSFDMFTTAVNGTDIGIYFEATGSTILGLHQMIVVEHNGDVIINAPDVEKYFNGPERFIVNVTDAKGNPLTNKSVNITINGVTYTRITDENGTASLNLRLGSGTYEVTTSIDDTSVKSTVTILSTVVGNDITKYYRNATQYSVQVFDTTGKAVGEGEVVTFNINGRFYNRTTDKNGIATLNINLPSGDYIITADYKGCKVSNNITVLPVLNATDLKKKYGDESQFKANLVDGQGNPYKDQFITFNVNGILYNRLTDSNGQAALNIRLPPGEYIITSSFNGANIANKITVSG